MSNTKPVLIMDQHFRQVEELFRPASFDALKGMCDVVGAKNWAMPRDAVLDALPKAEYVVAAQPFLDRAELDRAPNLKAVIEVSGTFQVGLDYDACFERGIEVLSCSPGFQFADLETVMQSCRTIVVAAMPTEENYHLIFAQLIASMQQSALLLVISRAHLVDFDAAVTAAEAGKIRLASDVFPSEPVPKRAAFRQSDNVIWSPHRAAAVDGGRHPIGDMIVDDIRAIQTGQPNRRLLPASPDTVRKIIRAPLAAS